MIKVLFIILFGFLNYSALAKVTENYLYGEFGFRSIVDSNAKSSNRNHIIIAGDSNVFGDGCKDDETISSLIAKDNTKLHVYNWGIRGGGPHDSLYLMEFKNALKLIKENKGIMLYNFFPFLTDRVIGSKNYLKWSHRNSPYYQLNSNNEAVLLGTFDDRTFITGFYRLINNSKFLNFLLPRLPQVHRWHLQLVAGIFKKMEAIYLKNFPDSKFVVVLNDSYDNDPKYLWQNKILSEILQENGIKFKRIPYVNNFKLNYTFKDGHINPAGQILQARFYNDLLKEMISDFK